MPSNIETQRFALRTNIARYQKILTTYLTIEERRFVERRLEEDKVALQELAGEIKHVGRFTYAA